MGKYKFKAGKTYLISDKENLNTIKISVLEYKEDVYYIYWHDEGIGQFCCKYFFDASFELKKELPDEVVKMKFSKR